MKNIVRNINKRMDYGKKRCKKDRSSFQNNLSFLCAKEKGITLLSLILTVVIMIILATVTINVIFNTFPTVFLNILSPIIIS